MRHYRRVALRRKQAGPHLARSTSGALSIVLHRMTAFTRQQVETVITAATQQRDDYVTFHLALLRQHVEKFESRKSRPSRNKYWKLVEQEAERLRRRIAILNAVSGPRLLPSR
jgi:hypothetical protein